MRKSIVGIISFLLLIIIMTTIIICLKTDSTIKNDKKIQIVATLFPQYDFAKQIVGDKADVKLLLNSGIQAHNYEPTAKDMISILNNSDMFLYNGVDLEPWTEKIVEGLEEHNCNIINVSNNIDLIKLEEFEEKNANPEIVIENHNNNEKYSYEETHNHSEEIYDEHIWMNSNNAIIMIDNILEAICESDSNNQNYYRENAEKYKKEILKIDEEIKKIVDFSSKREIVIGGEFAYAYLIDSYDLKFVSVYMNCGEGEDPSISKVKSVIDYINKHNIPVVYYEELSEGTVAKMIAEETKAKPLVLYSLHNGDTQKDTYISLMKKNVEALKEGLK